MNVMLDLEALSFVAERRQRRVAEAVRTIRADASVRGSHRSLAGRAICSLLHRIGRWLVASGKQIERVAAQSGSYPGARVALNQGK